MKSIIINNMDKILIVGIILSTIIAGAVLLNTGKEVEAPTNDGAGISVSQGAFIVNIADAGYDQKEFTVKRGQAVIFKNNTADGNFWPASNIHPTHEVYPEFDPKEPIPPGGEWKISFKREGVWRWHDHLRPSIKGIITVQQ